ncbi:MAG: S9 family peptidase [Acidobacteria bacterium]|nr:MAG: S9 family peptidase [Acidobacteriota bacterium]REK02602.1 MAG: S9 family peptidase [Acidobacteriota bacterium]REK13595.1 MAG: S9 family peptidase [Acidobacteriota bacterium]REK41589.1 MAG: S9 family peptidase [Acidobacteriota bacterium]
MNKILRSIASVLLILTACTAAAHSQDDMKPPVAKKEPKVTNVHGQTLTDNYFWMRDRNDKKSPAIIDYLKAENEYTDAAMKPHREFVEGLYEEMLGRIKQTDLSVPYKYGEYWYYSKTIEGKQYPVYMRSTTRDGKVSQTLLDQNEMAKGYDFFSIRSLRVSDDGKKLAYLIDTTGYRQYVLQVKDLETGNILPNRIERVTTVNWASDNNTLFVTTEDDLSKRSDKFWRHDLKSNKTVLIYEEKDVLFNIYAGRTRDGKYIFLDSNAKTMDEYRYVPADKPAAEPVVVLAREEGHEYSVDHYEGDFYITTNRDAENYRVVKVPVEDLSQSGWQDFIPHNPDIMIEGIDFFKGYAVVSELENGLEYLRVIDLSNGKSRRIDTPESVYTMGMAGGNAEFDTRTIMFNYGSMITPNSTFEYDLKTGERKLLKQQEVLGGYDKTKYETERVWATARDGVKVPVSIVRKKGVKLDGSAPMLLYAYGSYGFSITPNFSTVRLSLLDRGMIFGIAHIRGGGLLGEKWRQDGRMFKKLNTFYDFVDCSKWLVKNKYTSADKLVIQGGSAGGMLVGGVVNMAPEAYKAAIVQVPFVDVINTMMDESLPLTTEEWIEWGNPNEKEAFDYMIRYSPYDNVAAQEYPNLLVMISLNDSQVPYWEGAKFAAKVRELQTGDAQVLLKTNMGGGHGGASGRYDQLKDTAFVYAYALTQVGITN